MILSRYLPYEQLKEKFSNFDFEMEYYFCEGKIKKQTSGRCRYAEVKFVVINNSDKARISWETNKVPIEYKFAIKHTIDAIYDESCKYSLSFALIDGSFHSVDSSDQSFEIATFLALCKLVNFEYRY